MRTRNALTIVLAIAMVLAPVATASGTLVHRYSFDESAGASTFVDSVGSADILLVDLGGSGTSGGGQGHEAGFDPGDGSIQFRMYGGGKGNADYLNVPAAVLPDVTGVDATFEFWATNWSTRNWSRIFSFGSSNSDVWMASWQNGTNINQNQNRWNDGGAGANVTSNHTMAPYTLGQEFHIVYTIDATTTPGSSIVKWYKDGVFKGGFTSPGEMFELNDTTIENALGRSKWGDNTADASYNEFRVYDNVLSAPDILASFNKGTAIDDGTLDSNVGAGNWEVAGSWTGDVAGGVPTSQSIVNVNSGHTITVPFLGGGGAAGELYVLAGGTVVVDDVLAVTDTIDIAATGAMSVTGAGALSTTEITSASAGAVAIASAGTVTAATASTATFTFADATSTLNATDLTINSAIDAAASNIPFTNVTLAAGGSIANATDITAANLTVATPLTLPTLMPLNISGLLSVVEDGVLQVDDGFEVGGLGTVANFKLDGGTIQATSMTTNSDWDFQGGTIDAGSTLNGDFKIIVGAARNSDGTLLMLGTNNAAAPAIEVRRGAVRDIPAGHTLTLASNNDAHQAALEVTANTDVVLGSGIGEVNISGLGGFSASGGDYTVTMLSAPATPIATMVFGDLNGKIMLGSKQGSGSVTLTNDINFESVNRAVYAFSSDVDPTFHSKLGGALTNVAGFDKRGDGLLEIPNLTSANKIWVYEGALRVTGALHAGATDNQEIQVDGAAAALIVPVGATVDANRLNIYNGGHLDVAGTLTTTGNEPYVKANSSVTVRSTGYIKSGHNGGGQANKNLSWDDPGMVGLIEKGGVVEAKRIHMRNGANITINGRMEAFEHIYIHGANGGGSTITIGPGGSLTGHYYENQHQSDVLVQGAAGVGNEALLWIGENGDNNTLTRHAGTTITIGEYGTLKVGNGNAGGAFGNKRYRVMESAHMVIKDGGHAQVGYFEVQSGALAEVQNGGTISTNGWYQNNNAIFEVGTDLAGAISTVTLRDDNNGRINDGFNALIQVGGKGVFHVGDGHAEGDKRWRTFQGTVQIDTGGKFIAGTFEGQNGSTTIVNGLLQTQWDVHMYGGNNTLAGEGTIDSRDVYMTANDVVAPGNSTGTLTSIVTGEFKMQNGSVLEAEIGSTSDHDLLAIAGKVNFDSTWKVVLQEPAGAMGGIIASDVIDLITFTSVRDGLQTVTLDTSAVDGSLLWNTSAASIGIDADSVFITGLVVDVLNYTDTYTWENDADPAAWSKADGWDKNGTPNSGPPTLLDRGIVGVGTAEVNSAHSLHTLEISGTGAVDVQSNTLNVTNDLTISDTASLTVGVAGVLEGVNTLAMTGGSLDIDGSLTAKILNATGGTVDVSGTVTAPSVLLGNTANLATGAIFNAETVSITGGTTTVSSGVTVNGDFAVDGGTLAITGDVSLGNLVYNAGTFDFGGTGNTLTVGTFRQNGGNSTLGAGDSLVADKYVLNGGTVGFAMTSPSSVETIGNSTTLATGFTHTYTGTTSVGHGSTLTMADSGSVISSTGHLVVGGTLNMNGNLTTTSVDGVVNDLVKGQLSQSIYFTTGGDATMDMGGATFEQDTSRTMTGDKANTVLTLSDQHSGFATSEISGWNTFPTFNGNAENFNTVFSGSFIPSTTGTYGFQMEIDDREWMWLDFDHDGIFQTDEKLGNDAGDQGNKTIALTAGEEYEFIAIGRENAGGQSFNWYVTKPGGARDRVNPSDVAGNGGQWGSRGEYTGATRVSGTLNIGQSAILDTFNVLVDSGGVINVNDGVIDAPDGISLSGTLKLADGDGVSNAGLTRETAIVAEKGGRVNITNAGGLNQSSQMLIKTFGTLQGDLTNLVYSNTAGSGVVTFEDNAVLDPTSGGATLPTLPDVGGVSKLLLEVKAVGTSIKAGELVESLGDTAFKGIYISPLYPDGGTYNGTLTSGGVGDVYIVQDRSVRYNGSGIFNTASGNVQIDVISAAQTWVQANSFFNAGGTADRVDIDYDPALKLNNNERIYFEGDGAVPDGKTVAISGARARTNNSNNFRGTVEIGDGASLFVHKNIADHAGTQIIVNDGGNLWISDDDRIQTIDASKVTFNGESTLVLQANNQNWDTGDNDSLIMLKADLQITDNHAYKGTQGLMIGDGHYLKGGHNAGESRVHGNSTFFRAEAGASWVGLAAFNRRWMNIDEPFDAQGADVRIGSETEMWTNQNHDNHTRLTEIPNGRVHFRKAVTNVGTMFVKSGELYVDNAYLNGTDMVIQGGLEDGNNMNGGVQLRGTNWRQDLSTITTEADGFLAIENWNGNTKIGSLFINNANGLRFQGGETGQIVDQLGGTGSVKTGNDGHVRMLATSVLTPGDTDASTSGVATLALDDLYTDAGFQFIMDVDASGTDLVTLADRLEMANAWTLKIVNNGGVMGETTEYDIISYGGSRGGAGAFNQDILALGEVTLDSTDPSVSTWDFTNAEVWHVANRVYVTGIDGLAERLWKDQDGTWGDISTSPSVNWTDELLVDAAPPTTGAATTIGFAKTATVATAGQAAYSVDITTAGASLVVNGTGELTVGSSVDTIAGVTLNVQAGGVLNAATLNSAGTTTIAGGGAIGTLNSSGTTDLTGGGTVGTLNVTGGTTTLATPTIGDVDVSGGALNTAALAVDNFTAGGAATVVATGAITATGNTSIAATFNTGSSVTGNGSLTFDGTDDNVNTVDGTGVVFAGKGGAQTLINNGANFTITAGSDLTIAENAGGGVQFGQLSQSMFFSANQEAHINMEGSAYEGSDSRVLIGDKAGTVIEPGSFTDQHSGLATGQIQNWNSFPTYNGNSDNMVTAFSGVFRPSSTGTYRFRMDCDDRSWMWIDMDGSGVFDAGENVGNYEWHSNGTKDLVAGTDYNFIAFGQEFGGGQSVNWFVTPPGQGEDRVNPSDVAGNGGQWGTGVLIPGGTFGELVMGAGSTLTLGSADTATFESITAADGTTINGNIAPELISVGASPGTLVVNGDYTATATSNITWEDGDLIDVNSGGDVDLVTGWGLTIAEAVALAPGGLHDVIQFEGVLSEDGTPLAGSGILAGNVTVTGDPSWAQAVLMYDADSIFVVGSADALWDGAVNGDWTDANWDWQDFGGLKVPPTVGTMTIDQGGTVAVTSPTAGMIISLNVGGVIASTLNVASDIDVITDSLFDGNGVVNIQNGGTLGSDTVTVSGTSALTIDLGGVVNAGTSLDVSGTASLTVNGQLNAPVVNTAGTTLLAAGSTGTVPVLNITGGTTTMDAASIAASIVQTNVSGTGTLVANPGLQLQNLAIADVGTSTVNATNTISITGTLNVDGKTASSTGAASFKVSGANIGPSKLLTLDQAGEVTLSGPAGAPASIQVWYDSSVGVSVDGSNNVTGWADQSGNGRDATTTGGTPLLVAGGLNGLPIIEMRRAGGDDFLDVAGDFFAKEIYSVVRSPNAKWDNYGATLAHKNGRNSNWGFENNNTNFHGNQNPDAVSKDGVAAAGFNLSPITDWMILKVVVNNNDTNDHTYQIGRWDNNYSNSHDIAEILAFSTALTVDEENNVGGYLANKYGIAAPNYTGDFVLDMTDTSIMVANAASIVNVDADEIKLGDLGFAGGIGALELKGAEKVSFNNVIIAEATVITTPGALGVRGNLYDGGFLMSQDLTVTGDLIMEASSTMLAEGVTITVENLINEGGTISFDAASTLDLTTSAIISEGGTTTFNSAASLTVDGGAGDFDLTLLGGTVVLPDVLPGDVGVLTIDAGTMDADAMVADLIVNNKMIVVGETEMTINGGDTFEVDGPNIGAARTVVLSAGTNVLTVSPNGGPDTVSTTTSLNLDADGITLDLVGSAATPVLGNVTLGAGVASATIGTATDATVGDLTIATGTPATINTPSGIGTVGIGGTLKDGSGDLGTDFTVNGDLAMRAGSTLNAVGATVSAKNFVNEGGTVNFDSGSTLNLTASTISNTSGTTDLSAAAVTGTIDDISVEGGSLSLPIAAAVSTQTLSTKDGAVLNAGAGVNVSDSAVIGDFGADKTTATVVSGAGFTLTGSDVNGAHTMTLNGGEMNFVGPTFGGGAILPAGAVIWLDASDINGDGSAAPADGAPVSVWADKSGVGATKNDAIQTIVGDQPKYVAASGLNSMPAVRFDQDNDNNGDDMIFDNHGGSNGNNLAAQVPTAASWYAVTTLRETANKRYNIFGNTSSDSRLVAQQWNEVIPGEFRTNRVGMAGGHVIMPDSGNHMFSQDSDPATYTIVLDGVEIASNAGNAYSAGNRDWILGNRGRGDSQALNGDIAEFIIFDRILTPTEKNDLGGYLAAKYGLTTPYTGSLPMPGAGMSAPNSTLAITANSTVNIDSESLELGGLSTSLGVNLLLNSQTTIISLTNLTMDSGSMIRTSEAISGSSDVDVSVSGKLAAGQGIAKLGEYPVDNNFTTLTLADGATFDWTLGGTGSNDAYLEVGGDITIAGALDINLLDGGVSVGGVDTYLLVANGIIDDGAATINVPAVAGWSWDSVAVEMISASQAALILKNLAFTSVSSVEGDANGDGDVDDDDLALFQAQFGLKGPGHSADVDGDNDVDLDDFVMIRGNFGFTSAPEPAAPDFSSTPEPATMSLLAIGGLLVLRRRRRKA